jgi:hypothetical protein
VPEKQGESSQPASRIALQFQKTHAVRVHGISLGAIGAPVSCTLNTGMRASRENGKNIESTRKAGLKGAVIDPGISSRWIGAGNRRFLAIITVRRVRQ